MNNWGQTTINGESLDKSWSVSYCLLFTAKQRSS